VASRTGAKIERALLAKGFRYCDTDHRHLVLFVDGLATSIRTHVSHGGLEYGDDLLSKVKQQLHLPSKHDLLRLVDCYMDGAEYLSTLRSQGDIPSPEARDAPS
jgi:hypothetical protein